MNTRANTPTPVELQSVTTENITEDSDTKNNVNDILRMSVLDAYASMKDLPCPDFLRKYSGQFFVKPEVSKAHLEELKKMISIISCNENLEFRPWDQLREAWKTLILETQEYTELCEKLGWYVHFWGEMILQWKSNESFRNIYPQVFWEMPPIWRSEDEDLKKHEVKETRRIGSGW